MSHPNDKSRELITFRIDEQDLGIDIMAIREIRAWSPVTPLPHAPSYVKGVMNLRGAVLPILDLREQLGWGVTEPGQRHVILVTQYCSRTLGLIVDQVSDIITVNTAELQPAPELDIAAARLIEGLASVSERMVMVLDLDRLLARHSDVPASTEDQLEAA